MISEQQQEQASLYALGALDGVELRAFEAELRGNPELTEFVRGLQRTADSLAASRAVAPPPGLKQRVLERIGTPRSTAQKPLPTALAGLNFLPAASQAGWKELPVRGAYIKLLALEQERGYAICLGKLDPGVRYPAHVNDGPEDFFILTGDLVVNDRKLVAGDFHHADRGSRHGENYSVAGCTLLAVLTTDDPLVAFAIA